MWLASALAPGGMVDSVDSDVSLVQTRNTIWRDCEYKKKVSFHLSTAIRFLEMTRTTYDVMFIDCDKLRYRQYIEVIKHRKLLKPGGVLVIDNVLWKGRVLAPGSEPRAEEMNKLNHFLMQDKSFSTSILPIRDGVLVAFLKRNETA
jgi:caffeoyl-CoA O-methyltransferase